MARGRVPWSGWNGELLLALAVLLLTGLVIHDWSSQPASRYLLTVAAVDDHSLELDPYEAYLGIDQAHFGGHLYTDKAPYQPLLGAPAYQAYRWAGGDPFPSGFPARHFQDGTNYGLWWVTLWTATIPAAALALVVRRMVARTHAAVAMPVALAIVLGTTILPFSSWLFGHVLAAACIGGAWHLLRRDGSALSTRSALLAGCLLGLGIGTEYTVALIAVIFLVHVVLERLWSRAVALSAGTVVATLPVLAYNWLVFRDPFETAYQGHLKSFEGQGALGVYNLQLPRMDEVGKALVGSRGLFVLTPIVTLAVLGAVGAIVTRSAHRRDAWVGLAALVGMVIVSTGIDGLGGDSPGPRYLIPALPLLATPLAEAWCRAPRVCAAAAVFGGAWMWISSITTPAVDTSRPEPLRFWIDKLRDGDLATNVLTGHRHSWVLYLTTAAGLVAAAAAIRLSRHADEDAAS
jgi:hypothetical protein